MAQSKDRYLDTRERLLGARYTLIAAALLMSLIALVALGATVGAWLAGA